MLQIIIILNSYTRVDGKGMVVNRKSATRFVTEGLQETEAMAQVVAVQSGIVRKKLFKCISFKAGK